MAEALEQESTFNDMKAKCSASMSEKLFNRVLMNKEFNYDEQDFHFGISHAVVTGDSKPLCYTDTECKAELLTYALNEYKELKEENVMLKMVLRDLFNHKCGYTDCRVSSGKVSDDYCRYHKKIILALEDCER